MSKKNHKLNKIILNFKAVTVMTLMIKLTLKSLMIWVLQNSNTINIMQKIRSNKKKTHTMSKLHKIEPKLANKMEPKIKNEPKLWILLKTCSEIKTLIFDFFSLYIIKS